MRVTATDLAYAVGKLSRDQTYNYINPKNTGKIILEEVVYPEGPIYISRYDPGKEEGIKDAVKSSISTQMLWRIANAIRKDMPINFDRVLGASYNTRSALEALLAHTPEYYYSFPGRIEINNSSTEIKKGHKHIIWKPDKPHKLGVMENISSDLVISEIPNIDAVYEALVIPDGSKDLGLDIDIQRRHAQIQIAIMLIGMQLGSKIWIAQNDKGIEYKGKKIGEMQGVIASIKDVKLLAAFEEAMRAAMLIDCIWFKNSKLMPAVFEVEHSTGVTSGLTRMRTFQDSIPKYPTRWVIVAPDEDRDKVLREAAKPQFLPLNTQYFPYSAVEELYSLCQRRNIKGVTDELLDSFIEPCITKN